jgi:hypothetical protein
MTQAIISGRKSQTRRTIDVQSTAVLEKVIHNGQKTIASFITSQGEKTIACKFGTIGSRLWVKETFWSLCRTQTDFADAYMGLDENSYKTVHCGHYRFTKEEAFEIEGFFWKKMSSLFMPKVASRIQLEIIDIRIERLLDNQNRTLKKKVCWVLESGFKTTQILSIILKVQMNLSLRFGIK